MATTPDSTSLAVSSFNRLAHNARRTQDCPMAPAAGVLATAPGVATLVRWPSQIGMLVVPAGASIAALNSVLMLGAEVIGRTQGCGVL